MSQLENLIDLLKERKLTRSQLINYLNVTDREARRIIEKLRKEGHLIVNSGDGEGYFIPSTKSDAQEFMTNYYLHFKSMAETLEVMIAEFNKLED